MELLGKECRANLMHRNGGGEGCKHQESIEHNTDDISHHRNTTKSLLEDIRQGDKYERRTTVGTNSYGCCSREDEQARKDGYQGVEQGYLTSGMQQVGLTGEIAGIGAETCCTQR